MENKWTCKTLLNKIFSFPQLRNFCLILWVTTIWGKFFEILSEFSDTVIKEAAVQRCSVKKVFLEISQNSQENTCAKISFLIKLQALGLRPTTLLKKIFWHRCFPVNFAKFLRTPSFIEQLWWLLLNCSDYVRLA